MKKIIFTAILLLSVVQSAFALTLKEAKQQGLVGERNDGYIGYVVSPASAQVKALVKGVNNKRKAKFTDTAAKNNIKTEQVANRFYQRAITQTQAGHYYQNAGGKWVKKK